MSRPAKEMSWGDLVESQYGERSEAAAEQPERPAAFNDERSAAAAERPAGQPESSIAGSLGSQPASRSEESSIDLRAQMSTISDEMKAALGGVVEDMRSSIRNTSESARAEVDRLAADLRARVSRIEDELDARVREVSEQIGRVDDKLADSLDRTRETINALRARVEAAEAASSGVKSDIEDLAMRIERGLGETADHAASLTEGLESSLANRITDVRSSAREEVEHIGQELSGLVRRLEGLDGAFHSAMDSIDGLPASAQSAPAPAAEITGTINLNDATFEQLRRLGFSVTQSARIIAHRDTHGGFTDPRQLHEIRGLSREDLELLRERTTL